MIVYYNLFLPFVYLISNGFFLKQLSSLPGEESQLELLLGHITSPYVVSIRDSFEYFIEWCVITIFNLKVCIHFLSISQPMLKAPPYSDKPC